jgi:parallel beta-helix repeat protein
LSRRGALALLAAGASVTAARPLAAFASPRARTFDVLAYGAAGDGVRDDAPAIQTALDKAALAGGGTVVMTPGTYRTTAPLLVGNRTTLAMDGNALILRDFGRQGIDGATICNASQGAGNVGVSISGGILRASSPAAIGKHLGFANVDSLAISNLYLTDIYNDWHVALQAVTRVSIAGMTIDGGDGITEDGIHVLSGSGISISGCTIRCGDDAIALSCEDPSLGPISGVSISSCSVYSNRANGVRIQSSTDQSVSGVRIQGLGGSAGGSHALLIADQSGRGLVHDITVDTVQMAAGLAQATVLLVDGGRQITLTGVTFGRTGPRPFEIRNANGVSLTSCEGTPTMPSLQSVLVQNSRQVLLDRFSSNGATQHALALAQVDNVDVRGCTLINAHDAGVSLSDATNVRVQGCTCRGDSWGVYLEGATSGNSFTGNQFDGNRSGPLNGTLGPSDVWSGNTAPTPAPTKTAAPTATPSGPLADSSRSHLVLPNVGADGAARGR